MQDDRRRAWRLSLAGAGWLSARDFRAACIVEDISALGAKVAVTLLVLGSLEHLPEQLTLTASLASRSITVTGEVLRVERGAAGPILGISFLDADTTELDRLITSLRSGGSDLRRNGGSGGGHAPDEV